MKDERLKMQSITRNRENEGRKTINTTEQTHRDREMEVGEMAKDSHDSPSPSPLSSLHYSLPYSTLSSHSSSSSSSSSSNSFSSSHPSSSSSSLLLSSSLSSSHPPPHEPTSRSSSSPLKSKNHVELELQDLEESNHQKEEQVEEEEENKKILKKITN